MNMSLSRKERRREGQSSEFYQTMRKSAAVVGTTITACSVVAPLLTPVQADAVENTVVRSNFAAPNTAAFITEIATYAQPVAQANDHKPFLNAAGEEVPCPNHLTIIFLESRAVIMVRQSI